MKTSEILNGAADAIREQGWRQGVGARGLCLVDAIAYSEAGSPQIGPGFTPACDAVRDHLATRLPIYHWNDEPGRTAEEVIEVLRAAAVIQEARENAEVKVLEPVR